MSPVERPPAVFLDPSGRRWRRVRRATRVVGVASTLLALALVLAVVIPPLLPRYAPLGETARRPRHAVTPAARQRYADELRRFAGPGAARDVTRPPEAGGGHAARADGAVRPLRVGFYVSWDDNSLASLRAHAASLDWVVGEWAFVSPGGDSLDVRVDGRVPALAARLPDGERPRLLLMVTNFSSQGRDFDARRLRRFLSRPAARRRAVQQLADAVRRHDMAGATIDIENVPDDLQESCVAFARELHAALAPLGLVTTQAVPPDLPAPRLAAYAAANDRLFVMLYDEHDGRGEAGPVASQPWFEASARRVLDAVPPSKAIFALGAYGYDWNDASQTGDEMTFQDVMAAARLHGATVRFPTGALNPYVAWTDPDSTDHVAWYLDGVTAYNQMRAASALGAAGVAVWRLGAEDPSLWAAMGSRGTPLAAVDPASALATLPAGYDVEFRGEGEILREVARPTEGRREVRLDPATALVVAQRVTTLPGPHVIARSGASAHRVALTFDDGPDGRWTPAILDTLRAHHAPATFFVIGESAASRIPLLRREAREGHQIGVHTFTHPNLALSSRLATRLELDATERLVEAVLDRRTALFRPPYFGDAEPTTSDELVPVGVASDRGYYTVGLHVDAQDWRLRDARAIVDTVLAQRARGNVVLLHDGGGDRRATLAALGPMIDALRARGDTLVLVSDLIGMTPAQAMPTLPPGSAGVRLVTLGAFWLGAGVGWGVYWVLSAAVVLGLARLAALVCLAGVQRLRARRAAREPRAGYAPAVSVVVPAYNEAMVITKTIASLLRQEYAGDLEIVVVDDGSRDDSYAVAAQAYGAHPRVSVYRKENGGKASALNHGIARARGEIVIGLDADTVFGPRTVAELVAPLADPRVGAVAGNAKVGNRVNLVTQWQAVEYVTSQNLDRRAFSLLDCITVVPGAVGAWRRALVLAAGGFSDETLAEDQDLTLEIRRRGHSIAYADAAVAWTEAPDTLRGLARQRFRWSFGTLQCMWKHRDALLRRRYGTLGLVAMPNVWLFQLLFAALSPIADLMFVLSLAAVWVVRIQHGTTYALQSLQQVLTFYVVFLVVDWLAAVVAFLLEPGEDRRLTWLIFLQRLAYRQVMYWVVVRSFATALRGHVVGWGKLERKGTVAPAGEPAARAA